jgi:hypothetical protein
VYQITFYYSSLCTSFVTLAQITHKLFGKDSGHAVIQIFLSSSVYIYKPDYNMKNITLLSRLTQGMMLNETCTVIPKAQIFYWGSGFIDIRQANILKDVAKDFKAM